MNEGSLLLIRLSSVLWGVAALCFVLFSVWLSAVDLSTRRLPNRLVAWATGSTIGLLAASSAVQLPTALRGSAIEQLALLVGGALGLFALFLLLWRLVPGGMGGGDVKVAPLVGGALGFFGGVWALVLGALIACLAAWVWGSVLRRSGARDRGVPFAPCLFLGAWCAIIALPLIGMLMRA